jgi:nitroreductase
MEIDICIKGRRSVRSYLDKPVPKEIIEKILEAGTWAPTAMGRQPWKFTVIENKETINYISSETKKAVRKAMPSASKWMDTPEDTICYNAPMLIFICAKSDKQWGQTDMIDCVLAAQNMFLKAYELGLGTCYMGFISVLSKSNPEVLRKAGVPEGYDLMVPMILGYPKIKQGDGKRKKAEVLKWI